MILHTALYVASMKRSLDFYASKLGFQVADDSLLQGELVRFASRNHYDAMRLVLLKVSAIGSMIELLEFEEDSALTDRKLQLVPHSGSITIWVQNLEARMVELESQGLLPVSNVFKVSLPKLGDGSIVFYEDPDGHMIELFEAVKA